MKRIVLSFAAIVVVSLITGIISSTPTFAGRQQPNNFPEAAGQVNDLCGDPNNPVAFAAYVSDLTFNDTTGAANYTINVLWRKCRDPETRAFAVVGNGDNESKKAICPMVGRYGNNADTYDCVKYTSNPRFTDNGGLSCDDGKINERCVNGDFGRIERQENEPGYGIVQTSLGMSSNVDPSRLQTSGSQTFGGTNVLCAYYKENKSFPRPGRMCQDLFITVSWSRPWTINGQSYIKNSPDASMNGLQQGTISALPGDKLNWYHDMRNNGPNNTPSIYFNVDKTGFTNGWNDTKDPRGNASGRAGDLFVREYASESRPYTLYDVTQNDVGNTLCQRISWNPASHDNSGWGSSNYACANVPYRYNLIPSLSGIVDGTAADSTGPVSVDGYINNEGPTKSRELDWQVSQIVYPASPGNPPQSSGGTGAAPCTFFTAERTCRPIGSGTIGAGVLPGNHGPFTGAGEITDEPVGSKICFVMSVRRYNQDANDWRHSALSCRIVSKSPKVQVKGGDVVVGKGASSKIATSITRKGSGADERTFGSWGEYAVTASGRVYGMASGAGYAGQGAVERNFCTVSYLTVTNAGDSKCSDTTNKGLYTYGGSLPAVGSRFTGGANRGASPTINLADGGTNGVITATGTIRLSASSAIAAGKSIIINAPTANVLITSDILYTDAQISGFEQIPQVVIIANNISIQGNVGRVDAWLIASGASGQIITCSDVASFANLNSNTCGNPLTVNGPVAARQLFLYRTGGSGIDRESGDPAELFNLRPDAYLWASNYDGGSSRLQTATSTELPPRF